MSSYSFHIYGEWMEIFILYTLHTRNNGAKIRVFTHYIQISIINMAISVSVSTHFIEIVLVYMAKETRFENTHTHTRS